MHTTRRDVLKLGTLSGLSLALPGRLLASADPVGTLTAREASVQLAPPGYPPTAIWGYDGTAPGPVLRVKQGDRLRRRFVNDLPQPSSVHWHGIRIDNAMDGVAGLTQTAVAPGESFDYDFAVRDAGTYWYHAHNRSAEQVGRGLYGALVVEEADGPDVDRDEILVLDDWRLDPRTARIDPVFDAPHDLSHAGRWGNLPTVNGRFGYALPVRRHERLRLRLINAANARIFQLALSGLDGWTVALDGMPLDRPQPLGEALLLGPGQRADLLLDVTADTGTEARLLMVDDGQGYALTGFPVSGEQNQSRRGAPAALTPNPDTGIPELGEARKLRMVIEGGAMGRMRAAELDGARKSFRDLAQAGQFWALNGVVGLTDAPMAALSRGEVARMTILNDTAFPHAMHLHGMHFRTLGPDGRPGPLRDTLLMMAGEEAEIAFAADNPGDWLFHCHMLSHAASGMMSWLRVS